MSSFAEFLPETEMGVLKVHSVYFSSNHHASSKCCSLDKSSSISLLNDDLFEHNKSE